MLNFRGVNKGFAYGPIFWCCFCVFFFVLPFFWLLNCCYLEGGRQQDPQTLYSLHWTSGSYSPRSMEENGSHLANCRWEECHWHSGAHPRTLSERYFLIFKGLPKSKSNKLSTSSVPPQIRTKTRHLCVFLLEGGSWAGRSLITWSEKFLPSAASPFAIYAPCVFPKDVCCGARTEIATALHRMAPCGVRLAATLPRKLVGSPDGPWWIGWVVWPKRFVAVEEADAGNVSPNVTSKTWLDREKRQAGRHSFFSPKIWESFQATKS